MSVCLVVARSGFSKTSPRVEWRDAPLDAGELDLVRASWIPAFAVRHFGVSIGVQTTDPGLVDGIRARLPANCGDIDDSAVDAVISVYGAGSGGRYAVIIDDEPVLLSRSREEIFDAFNAATRLVTSYYSDDPVFIHAGVVAHAGRAILLPGRTHAGKSTLVHELVRRGAVYYSDEYALLDRDGAVLPYPKPIALRNVDGTARRHVAAADIGAVGEFPAPVGIVLDVQYQPCGSLDFRPMTAGEAALALCANSCAVRRNPERALTRIAAAAGGARAFRSLRGEAKPAADAILSLAEMAASDGY